MNDFKIQADFSNPYVKDCVDVDYDFCKFHLEFDDSLKITLNCDQFENMLKKLGAIYTNTYGAEATIQMAESWGLVAREIEEVV